MGIFDWIVFEMDCPKCRERVKGFQSKDHDCELNYLLPHAVRRMYADCTNCGRRIEFKNGVLRREDEDE